MDQHESSENFEIFIGIKADSFLQDRFQTYLMNLTENNYNDLKLELCLIKDDWFAGARISNCTQLAKLVEKGQLIRQRLIESIPDAKFPENHFKLFPAPQIVPAVFSSPSSEDASFTEEDSSTEVDSSAEEDSSTEVDSSAEENSSGEPPLDKGWF